MSKHRDMATAILEHLNAKGADLGNASIGIIDKAIDLFETANGPLFYATDVRTKLEKLSPSITDDTLTNPFLYRDVSDWHKDITKQIEQGRNTFIQHANRLEELKKDLQKQLNEEKIEHKDYVYQLREKVSNFVHVYDGTPFCRDEIYSKWYKIAWDLGTN